ncbi:hypothetical protein [Thiomicrorhabdus sp.]|uniref:hypothetical protein n=1 Tax=Thiomicrorhabdus sp. TaxID=2039724 RepID=UPI0029C7DEC7|nr:hypothetical protein [Thiomicrorhabdus sp.]
MKLFAKTTMTAAMAALLLSGCGGGSDSTEDSYESGLPENLTLSFIDAASPQYFALNTNDDSVTDLNDLAAASGDSAVQKLALNDTSVLGSIFFWPDFRLVNGEEKLDGKYLVMKPDYVAGDAIDSTKFVQLVHFHDTELAAHSADEYEDPEEGSREALALERLNAYITEQNDLKAEIEEVLPEDQILCRAYVDPYLKFELEQDAAAETTEEITEEEAHDHGDLMHFALTKSGRVYFYKEGENGLESAQGFVVLDDVEQIENCERTTIARSSEDGVLIFVPDSQSLYLVDSHGADYHQHSQWSVPEVLQNDGLYLDMMAVLGEGAEHDHEESEEE